MVKYIGIFVLAGLLAGGLAAAGPDPAWDKDPALRAWSQSLPAGWVVKLSGSVLIAERVAPIWLLAENKINAPLSRETPAQRSARIQKYGHRDRSSISLQLTPLRPAPALWSGAALPPYLSDLFEVTVLGMSGAEDDMTSIDPPAAGEELARAKSALFDRLTTVLVGDQNLGGWMGKLVALKAVKSREIWQHIAADIDGFPYMAYVDWGQDQTVAYSRQALPGKGPWELRGRIIAVGGGTKGPEAKESVEEYQLQVESVRAW